MTAFSDYLEAQILNHIFRNTAIFAPPANVYIAAFTAAPSDAGGGTEVSGGSYARKQVSTTGEWTAPDASTGTENVNVLTFPEATANWGTITHIAIFDAATGGNMLFWGALNASKVINSGNVLEFTAGELDVILD